MVKNRNKNRIFRYNRRIRGLTDYGLRLKLLKSNMPRVVIRSSNNNMLVQFTEYDERGDKILVSAKSNELKKLGFTLHTGNLVASYLAGLLAGKKALLKGITGEVIVDLGLQRALYGGKIFAAVKGVKDSGVNVRVRDVVFPSEKRLAGEHLCVKNAGAVIEKVKKAIEGLK